MKKTAIQISTVGLFLSSFGILVSTLFGFGGFSIQAFSNYVIIGYVSRVEMIFLFVAGLGFILSGIGNVVYCDYLIKRSKFIFLFSYLIVGIMFIALAIFGGTSQLVSSDFWANTTFKKIQDLLIFNNLSLVSFLAIGALQLVLLFTFFNDEFFSQGQLLNVAKILTLISGILWITKSVIDYPLIKEAIFVLSYELNFPLLNNILSIVAPLIYFFSQMFGVMILLCSRNL